MGINSIADRAQSLRKGPLPYRDVFVKAMPDLWSPDNPDGWILTVVAENKLEGNGMFLEKMLEARKPDVSVMNYGNMTGHPKLQDAICKLLNRTFVPDVCLERSNLCILSGCSSIIDSLFFCLGEAGQSVLIPVPYYPAFDNDLEARCNLVPTGFELDEGSNVAEQLDAAAEKAKLEGHPVCALLITNPNNPLGTIYKEDTVRKMIEWSLRHHVHYVSDEIYGLSIHKEGADFKSALCVVRSMIASQEIAREEADAYVHMMYGMSKDWTASGLRIGCLYSNCKPLHEAINSLAQFGSIRNHQQHVVADALLDEDWTQKFIQVNCLALRQSYQQLTGMLQEKNIPYVEAEAGMFVWISLRPYLPEDSWDGERKLWTSICDSCKVILTPGESCHAPKPGYFRMCFAWIPREALSIAVERMYSFLESRTN